jgi:2,3-dihydro-2,3-dihydroxybenzoate dehydrogenase
MPVLNLCDLSGRKALITGAQRGIGFSSAEALASFGATIALADLPGSAVDEARARLSGEGHSSHTVDVSDQQSVARLVREVVDVQGSIDVLVNCAGILTIGPFLDLQAEEWDRVFGVNARGSLLMAQAVARQMIDQGRGGRIILFSSNIALVARLNLAAYSASKGAVLTLMKCLALELAPHRITVNALCPGSTDTQMLGLQSGPEQHREIIEGDLKKWRVGIPLGRLAQAEDQAAVVAFLASDGARHITGQFFSVDGGQRLV